MKAAPSIYSSRRTSPRDTIKHNNYTRENSWGRADWMTKCVSVCECYERFTRSVNRSKTRLVSKAASQNHRRRVYRVHCVIFVVFFSEIELYRIVARNGWMLTPIQRESYYFYTNVRHRAVQEKEHTHLMKKKEK